MPSNGYNYTDSDGDRLHVRPWSDVVRVDVTHDGRTSSVLLPEGEALTLALAVLGSTRADSHEVKTAKRMIRRELRERDAQRKAAEEAERAEAAAREELERVDALAWSLYKAHWGMTGSSPDHWVVASPGQAQERDRWRKVARAARAYGAPAPSLDPAILPPFVLVKGTRNLRGRDVVEYGVMDRHNAQVAPFGSLAAASTGLAAIADRRTRFSYRPTSDYALIEEI